MINKDGEGTIYQRGRGLAQDLVQDCPVGLYKYIPSNSVASGTVISSNLSTAQKIALTKLLNNWSIGESF